MCYRKGTIIFEKRARLISFTTGIMQKSHYQQELVTTRAQREKAEKKDNQLDIEFYFSQNACRTQAISKVKDFQALHKIDFDSCCSAHNAYCKHFLNFPNMSVVCLCIVLTRILQKRNRYIRSSPICYSVYLFNIKSSGREISLRSVGNCLHSSGSLEIISFIKLIWFI